MPCRELLEAIRAQPAESTQPPPVVAADLFFDGNDDWGSIGCNLLHHPGVQRFRELLTGLAKSSLVQAVLVEISDMDEGAWPFSERVYVITSADPRDVETWVADLQPDEVSRGWAFGTPPAAPEFAPGHYVVALWWD